MNLKSDTIVKCLKCGKERRLGTCQNCGHDTYREDPVVRRTWDCARCEKSFYESGFNEWKCECGTSNKIKLTLKNDCFIATAAYGSASAKSVSILRNFRDTKLKGNPYGNSFINFYEQYSPPIAQFIAKTEILKFFTRLLIVDPAAWIAGKFISKK